MVIIQSSWAVHRSVKKKNERTAHWKVCCNVVFLLNVRREPLCRLFSLVARFFYLFMVIRWLLLFHCHCSGWREGWKFSASLFFIENRWNFHLKETISHDDESWKDDQRSDSVYFFFCFRNIKEVWKKKSDISEK